MPIGGYSKAIMRRPGLISLSSTPKLTGKCHICLMHAKLTDEHVPPKSAFNDCPRLFQRLFRPDKSQESAQWVKTYGGFKVRTLCASCNNVLCATYAEEYVKMVRHIAENSKLLAPDGVRRTVRIQGDTLYIAKQIAAMILAIESTQYSEMNGWLRNFVTDPQATVSPLFRVFGFLVPNDPNAGTINRFDLRKDVMTGTSDLDCHAGEVSFFPFGVVFAFSMGSGYGVNRMTEITQWFRNSHMSDRKNCVLELHSRMAGIDSFRGARGERRSSAQVDFMGY